jgi:4-carboxymuconolactone decarboxylase
MSGRVALLRVAAALDAALEAAASGAEPDAVEELLLQAHLFVGFADALNALASWRERSGRDAPAPLDEDPALWPERGEAVCAAVYGRNYARLRSNVRALHPEMDAWMVTAGYGRVLGRPGLDLVSRELCVVALLAAWGAPRQLHSHLRGALNVGASPGEVTEAVEAGCEAVDGERAGEARRLWAEVREAFPVEREASRVS